MTNNASCLYWKKKWESQKLEEWEEEEEELPCGHRDRQGWLPIRRGWSCIGRWRIRTTRTKAEMDPPLPLLFFLSYKINLNQSKRSIFSFSLSGFPPPFLPSISMIATIVRTVFSPFRSYSLLLWFIEPKTTKAERRWGYMISGASDLTEHQRI